MTDKELNEINALRNDISRTSIELIKIPDVRRRDKLTAALHFLYRFIKS